jgi:hypothetical protein
MTRTRLMIVVALLVTVGLVAPANAGQRQARGGARGQGSAAPRPGVAAERAVPRGTARSPVGGWYGSYGRPYYGGYTSYRGYPYYRSYPYSYRGYSNYYRYPYYPSFSVGIGFGIGFGFGFSYGYPYYAYPPYPYYAYPPYPYYSYPPPYGYYGYPQPYGSYGAPPAGNYGAPPGGTYGAPPAGTYGAPPAGNYGSPSPGNYSYPSYSSPANPPRYYGNGSSVVVTPTRAYGSVRIQDAPRDAQVFADGRFVGVAESFDGTRNQLNLVPGVHQIGIRRAGYQTVTADVTVEQGQTVVYRAPMHPLQSTASLR